MASLTTSPSAYTIVRANEVIADQDSIVAICDAADHLAIDGRTAISTLIMCAQRIGEGTRGWREEGRWKGTRRSFGKQTISGFEVVR